MNKTTTIEYSYTPPPNLTNQINDMIGDDGSSSTALEFLRGCVQRCNAWNEITKRALDEMKHYNVDEVQQEGPPTN